MGTNSTEVRGSYLGWSGFRIDWPGGPPIFLDPPDAESLQPDEEAWLLLSHGHPEHVAGTIEHLSDPTRTAPVTVVASAPVCRHLSRRYGREQDQFVPCQVGQKVNIGDLQVDVFPWQHMRLLPPGIGAALKHLTQVARHPLLARQIIRKSIWGPPAGAMLGYRLVPKDGPRILWYSEGLHRLTPVEQIKEITSQLKTDVLLFAIEPEDLHIIEDLLRAVGSPTVIAYEAHRPWREGFGMEVVDVARLTLELQDHGFHAPLIGPGQSHVF